MLENYKKLNNGVIKQISIENQIQKYDVEYITSRYNSYGVVGTYMSYLRLGALVGVIGNNIKSILDVGYGNGDFLKLCNDIVPNCYGSDITNYPLPSGIKFIDDITSKYFEVVCFFDSLEHFESISFVKDLKCKYIYISVPWCHYLSDDWFETWKHRRPDEHLWHFDDIGLNNFFVENGYKKIYQSNLEDIIRKPKDNLNNILTCIFVK
jgi:hypothetical protein